MSERVRFLSYDNSIDPGMVKIVNRLNDLNWRTLHCCEGHCVVHAFKSTDIGWGDGALIPKSLGIDVPSLTICSYICIYGTEIAQYGVPEYWYIDQDEQPTCYDEYYNSFCMCTTLRVKDVPYTLKIKEKPDRDGLIRGHEVYNEILSLKEKALHSLYKWVDALPYNISEINHCISTEDWLEIRRRQVGEDV